MCAAGAVHCHPRFCNQPENTIEKSVTAADDLTACQLAQPRLSTVQKHHEAKKRPQAKKHSMQQHVKHNHIVSCNTPTIPQACGAAPAAMSVLAFLLPPRVQLAQETATAGTFKETTECTHSLRK
jgi:hypothetical protein